MTPRRDEPDTDDDEKRIKQVGPGPQLGHLQLFAELFRALLGKEPKHEIEPRDLDEHYTTVSDSTQFSNVESIADLQTLPFDEFEQLVADLYRQRGFDLTLTPPGPDDGLDAIAHKESDSVGIQAKRYQDDTNVSARTIRATHGAARQRDLNRAAVATTSGFSTNAEQAASSLNMELIAGHDILTELNTDPR